MTVIIIAQRISSVRHADKIVILEDDHIAGEGTHDELLASNAIYQGIFADQSYEEVVKTLDIWYLNNGTDVIRRRNE